MVTIKEIAALAGVSIGTVDRVIHNRGRVSGKNVDAIHRIIAETGYKPNLHASSLSSRKTYHIAIMIPALEFEDGFWSIPERGIRKAASELTSYKIKVEFLFYNRYRIDHFQQVCQEFSHKIDQYDGLLLAPVLTEPAHDFLIDLPSGFPVVLIDSPVPNAPYLSCVSPDSYRSGRLAGRLLDLLSGPEKTIALIRSSDEDFHISSRINGFLDYFRDRGNTSRLTEMSLTRKAYVTLMEEISLNPEITGLFISDASVHTAARYFKEKNNHSVRLIGYELTDPNRKLLKEGWIDFLLNLRPDEQGYTGLMTLFESLVMQKQPDSSISLPIDILTSENIDFF